LWAELNDTAQIGSGNNGFKVVVRAEIGHFCFPRFFFSFFLTKLANWGEYIPSGERLTEMEFEAFVGGLIVDKCCYVPAWESELC
jgi:hypothetical protein